MANNRMYLVCKVCIPDEAALVRSFQEEPEQTLERGRIKLAKYYPSSGWYRDSEGGNEPLFSRWMEAHEHDHVGTAEGPEHFELRFCP